MSDTCPYLFLDTGSGNAEISRKDLNDQLSLTSSQHLISINISNFLKLMMEGWKYNFPFSHGRCLPWQLLLMATFHSLPRRNQWLRCKRINPLMHPEVAMSREGINFGVLQQS